MIRHSPDRNVPAAVVLGALTLLFLGRVVGQLLAATGSARYLPPFEEWQSGLLPYPLLLVSQVVILLAMLWIDVGVWRGKLLNRRRPLLGRWLLVLSLLYAGAMAVRYLIAGHLNPSRRWWPPGSIPILFHLVLAGYLFTLSRLAMRRYRQAPCAVPRTGGSPAGPRGEIPAENGQGS